MLATYKVISASDFLKATASGALDLEASKRILTKLAALNTDSECYDILLDIRKAYSIMSGDDLPKLIEVLYPHKAKFQRKIAIVYSGRNPDQAAILEHGWREFGVQVNFFLDFDKALDWLTKFKYFEIDYNE